MKGELLKVLIEALLFFLRLFHPFSPPFLISILPPYYLIGPLFAKIKHYKLITVSARILVFFE